jgi:hypothetical protein
MSPDARLNRAQESRGFPRDGSARQRPISASGMVKLNLQLKGFGGGVPPNTETAAVKPRAGIE